MEWIYLDEGKVPEEHQHVILLFSNNSTSCGEMTIYKGEIYWYDFKLDEINTIQTVIAWMPLPEAPKINICEAFEADNKTSSATICKNCGREKFLHPETENIT